MYRKRENPRKAERRIYMKRLIYAEDESEDKEDGRS